MKIKLRGFIKTCLCLLVLCCACVGAKAQADSTLVIHTVQKGENMYRISLKYNVSVDQIKSWNRIANEAYIQVGQKLKIWKNAAKPGGNADEDEEYPVAKPKKPETTYEPPPSPPDVKLGDKVYVPKDTPRIVLPKEHELVFGGTRIAEKEDEYDTTGTLDFSGYVSAYYAYYTDSVGYGNYQKFPTISPRSNSPGINLVQISAKYKAEKVRGIFTLHWGDVAQSAWSPEFNMIQQANLGIRIFPKLWLDGGFFRTHLGLESVQPRENINSSVAVTTFFDPYYLAGAKLTYSVNKRLSIQANVFNSYNGFVETNKDKAFGLSAIYEKGRFSLTINAITNDDSPDGSPQSKRRYYGDLYLVYKTKKMVLGFEMNTGAQLNSKLADSNATATMLSTLLAVKYSFTKKFALYTRAEYFDDRDEMLTGPITNQFQHLVGLQTAGIDVGFEVKPIPNSYFRVEMRHLQTLETDETIFNYKGQARNFRREFIVSTGFWF